MLIRLIRDEDGQGMVEYVLIIALVAMLLVLALGTVKDALMQKYGNIENEVINAGAVPNA